MTTVTTATKEKKAALMYRASQSDLARIAVITPLFQQIDQLEIQTAGIYVQLGYQFLAWQKESERNDSRYSVLVNGKLEEVSYFKAAWVTAGFKQARVYRCINRAKDDMKANHPAPQGVLDLVANTGNLDLTKENVQEAIADAFLAAGQPKEPTQLQVMTIAADACQRAVIAPRDQRREAGNSLISTLRDYYLSFMKGSGGVSAENEQMWLMGATFICFKILEVSPSEARLLEIGRGTVQVPVTEATESATPQADKDAAATA